MANTTTPVKTQNTALINWQDITTGSVILSTAQDVSTKRAASFHIKLGRRSGTAFTAGWPNVRVEGSAKASGDDMWIPLFSYQMALGASIANTTLNGAVSAGATSCVVTAATNIAVGDVLFLGHTTDVTKYELVRVKGVSGTTVTFEESCTYAHDNSAPVTDQAEMIFPAANLTTYGRVRAVVDNAGSGQTMAAQVIMTTYDSDYTV